MTSSNGAATPALELQGVSKRYWKLDEQAMLLRSLLPFARPTRSELWALRDINLTLRQGETIGVIGRNGAGKTTLLRLMAGVTQPTSGVIRISGRVAPLISVGVGFHHEMSGRENVYVNGMLLGLTSRQVAERFDEIVAFSELGDFIDTPVKFYSSGMFMRLGFAVAVHSDPDILVVDEVLAVGDIPFQTKCFDRMRSLQAGGTAIVLVSHNINAVRLLCPRVLVIGAGRLRFDGDPEPAIGEYFRSFVETKDEDPGAPDAPVIAIGREIRTAEEPGHYVRPDGEVEVVTRVRFQEAVSDPVVIFYLLTETGQRVSTTHSLVTRPWRQFKPGDEVEITVRLVARLAGGRYRPLTVLTTADTTEHLLRDEGPMFYIEPRVATWGIADPLATIDVGGEDRTWRDSLMFEGGRPSQPPDAF